jgi:hypothetical protein
LSVLASICWRMFSLCFFSLCWRESTNKAKAGSAQTIARDDGVFFGPLLKNAPVVVRKSIFWICSGCHCLSHSGCWKVDWREVVIHTGAVRDCHDFNSRQAHGSLSTPASIGKLSGSGSRHGTE